MSMVIGYIPAAKKSRPEETDQKEEKKRDSKQKASD